MRLYKIYCLVVILLFLLSGCRNKGEIANLNKQIEELNINIKNLQDANNELKTSNETLESLNNMTVQNYESTLIGLNNELEEKNKTISILQDNTSSLQSDYLMPDLGIYDYSLSPNSQFASIMVIDYNTGNRVALMYDITNKTDKVITDGDVCQTFWSPDSKYFVIDSGTFVTRTGALYSIESSEAIKSFGYHHKLLWLNSEEVVYAKGNEKIMLDALVDPQNTTDIVIHNVFTDEIKTIYVGTDQYLYSVRDVEDGGIECVKRYIGSKVKGKEDEIVIYDYN